MDHRRVRINDAPVNAADEAVVLVWMSAGACLGRRKSAFDGPTSWTMLAGAAFRGRGLTLGRGAQRDRLLETALAARLVDHDQVRDGQCLGSELHFCSRKEGKLIAGRKKVGLAGERFRGHRVLARDQQQSNACPQGKLNCSSGRRPRRVRNGGHSQKTPATRR